MLYDSDRDELYFLVALGEKLKEIRLKTGEGIAGTVAKKKKSINVPDVTKVDIWYAPADKVSGFKTRCVLAVPMMRQNSLVGVIEVINKRC
ncbi:MAG TPA: GAF domain-containing protein [Candidatus Omnitrophica bacterium]|nr:GAF domain-containing protein [Candidatus Omnitrophota bacterium]